LAAEAAELGSLPAGESTDRFARTDLVSNNTVFRKPEYYLGLLRGEALPVETYSSFIHEATHHWCFNSPLGNALSLLYLSVAKRALRWACTDDDELDKEALDDLFVYHAAEKWLRPLSEGLAQFAEYDVLPPYEMQPSHVLRSPPTDATLLHLFNQPQRLDAPPNGDKWSAHYKLANDIISWRLSPQSIARKSDLLLHPLDPEQGGYLLGYLTVKQIWRSATRFYDELKNADLFMMFLRKLVYADFALVAVLLDRKRKPAQRALSFGKALIERISTVHGMLFDEDEVPWSKWEEVLTTPWDKESGLTFGVDQAVVAFDRKKSVTKGETLQRRYLKEVSAPLDFRVVKKLSIFQDYFRNVLLERDLLWLGRVDAKWVSLGRKRGRIMAAAEVLYDNYELTKASDEGLDDIWLDIYINLYGRYQVTTIGGQRGVFGIIGRHLDQKRAEKFLERKLDRDQIIVATEAIRPLVDEYARLSNYHEVFACFWKDFGRDLLNRNYRGFAFDFNKDAEKIVSERGIAEILENDADLVRSAAAITLAASAGLSPEELKLRSSDDLTIDPLETIRRVRKLWTFENLPLAAINSDGFLDSAF
jgi:hypothetical protein